MRILHVLDHGLPLMSGYTFRTRALMKAQLRRGWDVAAVTGSRHGDSPTTHEHVDGLDFYRTTMPTGGIPLVREVRAFAKRIVQAIDEFQPDVIHAHSPVLCALAALKAGRKRKLPVLYEIRAFWEDAAVANGDTTEGSWRYKATQKLETWAVNRADAVAVICEGLRCDLVRRGVPKSKILVSPNGVDLALFGEPRPYDGELAERLGLKDAEVIGFIGSFYDYEGLDDLIDAMPALVSWRPRAHLVLVGGGQEEEKLRTRAAASTVAEHIHFVGRVPHDMVDHYYSVIDILAYPRKRMRLTDLVTPLKPLEAMAQRRLVAASDVGGHRELIRNGDTGTLFPPDDPKAMARALAALLADRDIWKSRRARGRAFVEAERNWSSNIGRYAPVYQALTDASGTDLEWSRSSAVNA
ncbi:hypothetical protein BH09PSE4_BH09PSE4_13740 [soil metagenome]